LTPSGRYLTPFSARRPPEVVANQKFVVHPLTAKANGMTIKDVTHPARLYSDTMTRTSSGSREASQGRLVEE
jgi:hypothetical protein